MNLPFSNYIIFLAAISNQTHHIYKVLSVGRILNGVHIIIKEVLLQKLTRQPKHAIHSMKSMNCLLFFVTIEGVNNIICFHNLIFIIKMITNNLFLIPQLHGRLWNDFVSCSRSTYR